MKTILLTILMKYLFKIMKKILNTLMKYLFKILFGLLILSVGLLMFWGCGTQKITMIDKCNCIDTVYVPKYVKVPYKTNNNDSLMQKTIDELIFNNTKLHQRVANRKPSKVKYVYKNIKIKDSQLQNIQADEISDLKIKLGNKTKENIKLKNSLNDKSKDKSKIKTDNSQKTKTSSCFIWWIIILMLAGLCIYYRFFKKIDFI